MEDELGEMRMFNLLTLQDELVGALLGTQLPTEVTERGLERALCNRGIAHAFVSVVDSPQHIVWLDLEAARTSPMPASTRAPSSSSSPGRSRNGSGDSSLEVAHLLARKQTLAGAHRMLAQALLRLVSSLRALEAASSGSGRTLARSAETRGAASSSPPFADQSSVSASWGGTSGTAGPPLSQQLQGEEQALAQRRERLERDVALGLARGAGEVRALLARAEDGWRAGLRGLAGLLLRAREEQARHAASAANAALVRSPPLPRASASASVGVSTHVSAADAPSELVADVHAFSRFSSLSYGAEAEALREENARLREELARAEDEKEHLRAELARAEAAPRDQCRTCGHLARAEEEEERLRKSLKSFKDALAEQKKRTKRAQEEKEALQKVLEQTQQQDREQAPRPVVGPDEISVVREYYDFMGSCSVVFDPVDVHGQRVFRARGVVPPTFLERDAARLVPRTRGPILCRVISVTPRTHVESDVCSFNFTPELSHKGFHNFMFVCE